MKNAVILTAKGGNTSIENKNLILVNGIPVMTYPLRAAKMAATIHPNSIYVSTEDSLITDIALKEGAQIIQRPDFLSQPESQHKDVILHAVQEVEKQNPDLENVIVLLGNTVMVTPSIIDQAIHTLETGTYDSVLTGWKAQDDHPYRALTVNESGHVESFLNLATSSNRQSYPTVYFYDQGIWAFKKDCAYAQQGPSPWVWLGQRCKLIERPWVTGRDIHSWIDVAASTWYLNSVQPFEFVEQFNPEQTPTALPHAP